MAPGPITGDFPRGGASVLTPLELKEVNQKAKEDVLFKVKFKLFPLSFRFVWIFAINYMPDISSFDLVHILTHSSISFFIA
jgi:hypothetical protein